MSLTSNFFKDYINGLIFSNVDGEVLEINSAAKEILDTSSDKIPTINYCEDRWNFVTEHGDPIDQNTSAREHVFKSKKPIKDHIIGLTTLKGVFKWIKVDVVPVLDENNNVDVIYYHFVDITEQREKDNMLKLLSVTYYNNPLSIFITDSEGVIFSVNNSFLKHTGYSEKELIGEHSRILKHDKSTTDYKELWETISSGEIWKGEFYNKHKNGKYYTETSIIVPVKNNKNMITHYIGIKEDISDFKLLKEELENTLNNLEKKVLDRTSELKEQQLLTLESMAILAEFRDNDTGKHIQRTKKLMKFLVESLKESIGLSDKDSFLMWMSAPLHDIGKVAIPDEVLLKPGKLTLKEFEIMKKHSEHGYNALSKVAEDRVNTNYLKYSKEISLYHHEKWDGSGYPKGLKGNNIPFSARAMAIVDVYDALRSTRPYKKGLSHTESIEIIKNSSKTHFDPRLVEFVVKNSDEFNNIFESFSK